MTNHEYETAKKEIRRLHKVCRYKDFVLEEIKTMLGETEYATKNHEIIEMINNTIG